jgi:hypothetical protein
MSTSDPGWKSNAAAVVAFSARGWLVAGLVGLGVSICIISPFFWLGAPSGHDFDFHASSWLEAAAQWKQHITFPRWHRSANHGFGEPRFIFYPPLSWILGAALGSLVPWSAVPALFVILVQTTACLTAFALARRWLPFRAALAAGAFYAGNPYALLVVYVRSDFAEQVASAFLPLLFLFAFDLSDVSRRGESRLKSAALFAAAFAAVWLSNAPAGVLASYAVVLMLAWTAATERDWRLATRSAASLLLGFALAAFYLVPAAYEQKWVNIEQVLSMGLRPTDNFLYTATSDPEHTFFNWIASTIAVVLMIMTFAAAGAALARERRAGSAANPAKRSVLHAFLVVCAAAVFLMLRLSGFAWTLLPKLRFVQFPWRWMLILAVPFAFFLGACAARRLGTACIVITLSVSALTGVYLAKHTWWEPDEMPTLVSLLASGKGFEGTDEYDPAGDDHTDLPTAAPHARVLAAREGEQAPPSGVTVLRWDAEEKLLRIHAKERARVALRLLNYPAWRVEVNQRVVAPEHSQGTAQMVVQVPEGNSEIHVQFERTTDRTIGGAISAVAFLAAAALLLVATTGRMQA